MKRIKILHIQVYPKLSGVQRVSLEILKNLSDEEYDKYILFSDELDCGTPDECIKAFEDIGVKVILSPKLRRSIGLSDFGAFKEIYNLCRKEKFDIVHTNSTKPGVVGRIAAYMAGVPLVVHTIHGLAFHKFIKSPRWQFYWACEMFASCFCHKIVSVNKYYLKYFKAFKKKTSTIYNGFDFSTFPKITPKINDSNQIKILFVGRLDKQKDPMVLLEAAQRIIKTHPEVCFNLVGDGEFFDDCQKYINDNKLENNVFLKGWCSNVFDYYQDSDILASPSIFEACSLTHIEAAYFYLPICSCIGDGIPETVEHNRTGLLCTPKDVNAFTENLLRLINDVDLRKKMGENAHERAISIFHSKYMINDYLQIYSTCKRDYPN